MMHLKQILLKVNLVQQSVHEISKSSASKSAAGQSSTPIVLIIAVICLIAVFVVGYAAFRNKRDNDEDDY